MKKINLMIIALVAVMHAQVPEWVKSVAGGAGDGVQPRPAPQAQEKYTTNKKTQRHTVDSVQRYTVDKTQRHIVDKTQRHTVDSVQRYTVDSVQRYTVDSLRKVIQRIMVDSVQRYTVDSVQRYTVDSLQREKQKKKYTYKIQVCTFDYDRIIGLGLNPFDVRLEQVLNRLNNEEKGRSCYSTRTKSDTTLNYSYGTEERVTTGYIYDNYGNKLETKEKELTGISLVISGDVAKFDYNENKKISLQNQFEKNTMEFRAEYTKTQKQCTLWVLCDYIDKKQSVMMEVTRE